MTPHSQWTEKAAALCGFLNGEGVSEERRAVTVRGSQRFRFGARRKFAHNKCNWPGRERLRVPVEKLWQKFIKNLNSVLIFSLTRSFVLKQSGVQGNAQDWNYFMSGVTILSIRSGSFLGEKWEAKKKKRKNEHRRTGRKTLIPFPLMQNFSKATFLHGGNSLFCPVTFRACPLLFSRILVYLQLERCCIFPVLFPDLPLDSIRREVKQKFGYFCIIFANFRADSARSFVFFLHLWFIVGYKSTRL